MHRTEDCSARTKMRIIPAGYPSSKPELSLPARPPILLALTIRRDGGCQHRDKTFKAFPGPRSMSMSVRQLQPGFRSLFLAAKSVEPPWRPYRTSCPPPRACQASPCWPWALVFFCTSSAGLSTPSRTPREWRSWASPQGPRDSVFARIGGITQTAADCFGRPTITYFTWESPPLTGVPPH